MLPTDERRIPREKPSRLERIAGICNWKVKYFIYSEGHNFNEWECATVLGPKDSIEERQGNAEAFFIDEEIKEGTPIEKVLDIAITECGLHVSYHARIECINAKA